jgi:hypothetical protein
MKAKKLNTNLELSVKSFTTKDLAFEYYYNTDQEIKALEKRVKELKKELEPLKKELARKGTDSSARFVCIVGQGSRTNPPSVDKLKEALGEEEALKLCSKSTWPTVKVDPKGGE